MRLLRQHPRWLYRLRMEEPGKAPYYSRTIELLPQAVQAQVQVDPAQRSLEVQRPLPEKKSR